MAPTRSDAAAHGVATDEPDMMTSTIGVCPQTAILLRRCGYQRRRRSLATAEHGAPIGWPLDSPWSAQRSP
jgi:hypothetical protein